VLQSYESLNCLQINCWVNKQAYKWLNRDILTHVHVSRKEYYIGLHHTTSDYIGLHRTTSDKIRQDQTRSDRQTDRQIDRQIDR